MSLAAAPSPGLPVLPAVPAADAVLAVPDAPAVSAFPVPANVIPVHGVAAPDAGLSGQVQQGPVASATAAPAPSWMANITSVLRKLTKKKRKKRKVSSSAAASSPSTSKATQPRKKKAASPLPKKAPSGTSAGPPASSGVGPFPPSAKKVPSVQSPTGGRAAKTQTPELARHQDHGTEQKAGKSHSDDSRQASGRSRSDQAVTRVDVTVPDRPRAEAGKRSPRSLAPASP
ncbi:nascent polypeptide-associated complex subunit alpha, muscle-specific form-like [Macrobrachium nipponense]|uniref:nascent polypeptide-associated complex subunit alpha, muscle-specific form-like n=1 Tax=Macrobrachium nipponense TaxID=159736 RepID=UPI0030C8B1E3